jgi:hypothetical protein
MVIETNSAFISLIEEVVLVVKVKENMEIDVPQMWENYNATLQLCPKGDFPVLFETEDFVTITKEARELGASKEMAKDACAMAIMINSMAIRIFANFFIKFNKPMRPTKLFTDRDAAILWLKEQYKLMVTQEKKKNKLMTLF